MPKLHYRSATVRMRVRHSSSAPRARAGSFFSHVARASKTFSLFPSRLSSSQTLGRTIRQYPGVLLLPLLAWVLLAAGGILAVWFTAEREASHRRELAGQVGGAVEMMLLAHRV